MLSYEDEIEATALTGMALDMPHIVVPHVEFLSWRPPLLNRSEGCSRTLIQSSYKSEMFAPPKRDQNFTDTTGQHPPHVVLSTKITRGHDLFQLPQKNA